MGTAYYIYPLAFAINTFSMTGFMVILSLLGKPSMAADFGIVQGATIALFYAFSANARNLILNPSSKTSVRLLLISRLFLMAPLGAAALFLSAKLGGALWSLALILIIRRCTEWIAELHLSEREFRGDRSLAKVFIVAHSILFIVAIWWSLISESFSLLGIALWAILPLALHVRFIRETLTSDRSTGEKWVHISPHVGSTAIIGVTVYVFRLLILLLVGKALAGDLYTAYAIGGFVGSVYLHAVGPTLAHHERFNGKIFFPTWLKICLFFLLITGVSLFVFAERTTEGFPLLGKSLFFWSAIGLSMIGGSLMVLAQRIRISLLQLSKDRDVFGPDLIINIFIIAFVPFSFHLFGMDMLKALFLYNAFIAFIFYSSAKGDFVSRIRRHLPKIPDHYFYLSIAFVLVFPLFFQLTGKIFNDIAYVFDSKGILTLLPIPISVFACFGGLLLIGAYERARLSIYVIFLTFLLMLGTTIISSRGHQINEEAKLIFLIQFILPVFGLVLGQMFEGKKSPPLIFEKTVVFVLLLIVPAQLISTYLVKVPLLYSHLYLFSIYQHLQYVSLIFVCLYVLALHSLWKNKTFKASLIFLGPLMGIYGVLSQSMLAVLALMLGLLTFIFFAWFKKSDKLSILLVLLIACSSATTFYLWRNNPYYLQKYSFLPPDTPHVWRNNPDYSRKYSLLISDAPGAAEELNERMPNLSYRITVWRFYINGIRSEVEKLLFGHVERPSRDLFPSAHNYYLDLTYNFGLLATIPILGLLIHTIRELFRSRKQIISNSNMAGLVLVTLFLLVIDNSLKVGLRQPYPGIITSFLWGLLLSRLSNWRNKIS